MSSNVLSVLQPYGNNLISPSPHEFYLKCFRDSDHSTVIQCLLWRWYNAPMYEILLLQKHVWCCGTEYTRALWQTSTVSSLALHSNLGWKSSCDAQVGLVENRGFMLSSNIHGTELKSTVLMVCMLLFFQNSLWGSVMSMCLLCLSLERLYWAF